MSSHTTTPPQTGTLNPSLSEMMGWDFGILQASLSEAEKLAFSIFKDTPYSYSPYDMRLQSERSLLLLHTLKSVEALTSRLLHTAQKKIQESLDASHTYWELRRQEEARGRTYLTLGQSLTGAGQSLTAPTPTSDSSSEATEPWNATSSFWQEGELTPRKSTTIGVPQAPVKPERSTSPSMTRASCTRRLFPPTEELCGSMDL